MSTENIILSIDVNMQIDYYQTLVKYYGSETKLKDRIYTQGIEFVNEEVYSELNEFKGITCE